MIASRGLLAVGRWLKCVLMWFDDSLRETQDTIWNDWITPPIHPKGPRAGGRAPKAPLHASASGQRKPQSRHGAAHSLAQGLCAPQLLCPNKVPDFESWAQGWWSRTPPFPTAFPHTRTRPCGCRGGHAALCWRCLIREAPLSTAVLAHHSPPPVELSHSDRCTVTILTS